MIKDGNWEIKNDKDGITIEDAVPCIQISRTRKDKRVFGDLGDPKRSNTREERMIVNSVGEGGIMVCNSNGNIENGDYMPRDPGYPPSSRAPPAHPHPPAPGRGPAASCARAAAAGAWHALDWLVANRLIPFETV